MALDAGTVYATLGAKFNPAPFYAFDARMKSSAATMEAMEARVAASNKRTGASLATLGTVAKTGAAAGLAAVVVGTVKAIKASADYQKELSKTAALGGQYAKRIGELGNATRDLGLKTGVGATKAAQALEALAKGGLSASDILGGGLQAAITLSQSGTLSLGEAAETTASALNLFGLEGSQATHVADALAKAAATTQGDVKDFAMALSQGGSAAKIAGASFEDTVVILEALAKANVKNSDAGTSLKSFLLNIATASPKAQEAMKNLGLSIFDAKGDLKSLPAISENLRSAFGKLTKEQFLSKAGTIAGSDAIRTLYALYAAGPDKLRGFSKGLHDNGFAADYAKKQQDNLSGAGARLSASFEELGIRIGDRFQKPLQAVTDFMAKFIGEMSRGEGVGGTFVAVLAKAAQVLGFMFATPLKVISVMVGAVRELVGLFNKIPGIPDIPIGGLDKIKNTIDGAIDLLSKDNFNFTLGVKADPAPAIKALREIEGTKLEPKVAAVITRGDTTAKQKIAALERLGITPKNARIIVHGVGDALAGINAVKGALADLPPLKTVRIKTINEIATFIQDNSKRTTKKRAVGRGPGGAETALVGEGRGPELVGNPTAGWQVVDKPTLMGLGPEDSVIPYGDPKYAGRALGLMLAAMGVPGYAAGRTAFGRSLSTGRATPASKKKLAIPAAVRFGAVPEDQLGNERDDARERYQKRKDRVHDLDVDIRAQQRKVREAKAGPAKRKAQAKLSQLQRDRRKYQDGGDGLASVAVLRKRWQDLREQALVLHRTNLEIERLNTLQETDRTRMATAAQRGDAGTWGAARTRRGSTLDKLRALYARAVKYAKPGSNFAAELEGKLAGIEGDIAAAAGEEFEQEETEGQKLVREASERLFETGMTDEERAGLAGIEARGALAALTEDLSDDRDAAGQKMGFFENILRAVQADPARGGATAIRDIADQLKQARDNVASFSGGSQNDNADLQAQLDQAREEVRIAQRESQINSQALSVFQGWNGGQPQVVVNQTNQMLTPSDPGVLMKVGNAAVAGMSYQASRTSPRQNLGL